MRAGSKQLALGVSLSPSLSMFLSHHAVLVLLSGSPTTKRAYAPSSQIRNPLGTLHRSDENFRNISYETMSAGWTAALPDTNLSTIRVACNTLAVSAASNSNARPNQITV